MRVAREPGTGARFASGALRPPASCPALPSGFTLIEILVVVAIVAIIAAAAMLSVDIGGSTRSAEREARRLLALNELACERALATGHDYGLHLSKTGYAFSRALFKHWEVEREGELRPRELPRSIQLELTREDHAVELEAQTPDEPQITCAASGEMSPYRARVVAAADAVFEIRGEIDGSFALSDVAQGVAL